MDDDWQPLIRSTHLAEGEIRRCPLQRSHSMPDTAVPPGLTRQGTDPVVLLCRVEGEVHALADTCPHEAISLSLGSLLGHRLRCPLHGSEFDVRTGAVLSEPCEENLQRFEVEERNGWVCLKGR